MSVTGSPLCRSVPPSSFLCPYLYPSTHPSLFLPHPPLVVCLSFPQRFNFYHVTGERDGKKQKQIRLKPLRPLCRAIRLSLSVSQWVLWHTHDHEPTMRRGIASPWCMPLTLRPRCTQPVFQSDREGCDLIHRNRHRLKIELCVYLFLRGVYIRSHLLYLSHFSSWCFREKTFAVRLLHVCIYTHMYHCDQARIIHKCIIHVRVWELYL